MSAGARILFGAAAMAWCLGGCSLDPRPEDPGLGSDDNGVPSAERPGTYDAGAMPDNETPGAGGTGGMSAEPPHGGGTFSSTGGGSGSEMPPTTDAESDGGTPDGVDGGVTDAGAPDARPTDAPQTQ